MTVQLSDCCKAPIDTYPKLPRPECHRCSVCDRVIGSPLNIDDTSKEQVNTLPVTPANEWCEEFEKLWTKKVATPVQYGGKTVTMTSESIDKEELKDFIQNLLDQHSAHLVERISDMAIVDDYSEERKIGFQIAKDQAIDIVKDNK